MKSVSAREIFLTQCRDGMQPPWMAPARSPWSEVFEAEGRMGRRPLDRRCFRDRCAAARLQKWLPEELPQDLHAGEVIVGRLPYTLVEARVFEGAGCTHLCTPKIDMRWFSATTCCVSFFVTVHIGSVCDLSVEHYCVFSDRFDVGDMATASQGFCAFTSASRYST